MTTPYVIENALLALPHLVHCARQRRTLTYGELGSKIGQFHRNVPLFLSYIRDEICTPRGVPPINAIVVSKTTGLPGVSFLRGVTADLGSDEYHSAFQELRDEVFAYEAWYALLHELGLTPILGDDDELEA